VLTAYFDGAGKQYQPHNKVLAVAGFVATEERWLTFEPRWRKVLDDAGIAEFHMSDFINNKKQFLGWEKDQPKRERFYSELCGIILDTVEFSVGSGVALWDWNLVNDNYLLAENDFQPYPLVGWGCIERLKSWFDNKGHKFDEALFIFENGEEHEEVLKRKVEKDFGVILQTETKKTCQLQTADFASWSLLNLMRGHENNKAKIQDFEPWLLNGFARLFGTHRRDSYDHGHFSMKDRGKRGPSLLRLCREQSIPYRR
jgi:hypothetical protein